MCDDEDRDSTHRVAAQRPRCSGQYHGQWNEHDGKTIGCPDEGCGRCLGLFDQSDHACIGGVGRHCRGDQIQRGPRIDDTAADVVSGRTLHRKRFPGQRRLIEKSRGEKSAVHRNDLPSATSRRSPRATSATGISTTPPATRR